MKISENAFRDHLFEHHKEDLASLIVGRRDPIKWDDEDNFPPIRFLLQEKAEHQINTILDQLESVVLTGKELRLDRGEGHPTRVDLFGAGEDAGMAVIELKKSAQTERQAFTELLAYANHFCSIFPGLTESAFTMVLVAPMETRTARDAYAQELISNRKNVLALIPHESPDGEFSLEVYYPDASYYRWIENNILNDHSMTCVAIAFPIIEGWIDSDRASESSGSMPRHSVDALNTVANTVAHQLEALGFHALVYANQKWGEFTFIENPNCLIVAAMNPFSPARTAVSDGVIYGSSEPERLQQVQAVYDQLTEQGKELFWIDSMESDFQGRLIRAVRDQFEFCFLSRSAKVSYEISLPSWYGIKTTFIEAVGTHNLDVYTTGLVREVFHEYVKHTYRLGVDQIHYADDLHMFAYDMLHPFLGVWEILSGLGYEPEEGEGDDEDE
ncbi:hypothetical protein WI42_25290 [Burkholderia ubonensis]|nr:hypothetical protein WI42_25290 [Burkholderia ubonensis]